MRSMEFSGKTVDEAIFNGLNEMGVTIDEVEIETIQTESKGLFGIGAKQAIVRLTEREVPLVMEMEQVFRKEEARKEEHHGNRTGNRSGNRRAAREDRKDFEHRERRERRDGGKNGERRQAKTPAESYDYSEELAEATPAAQYLKELLSKMGITAHILAAETESGLRLRIDADTMGLLIGRRGETLDALQYLVSLYINKNRKEEGYCRVTLDTEGYRGRREDTLKRLARRNAQKVRETGRSVAMEPMNPYERRVLHSALQDFSGVTTHSEGEEPNRYVVITPSSEE